MTQPIEVEKLEKMCLRVACAVAPYAHEAPRKFHNDEKYLNVPFTSIETVAKGILKEMEAYADSRVKEERDRIAKVVEKYKCGEHKKLLQALKDITK